MLFKEIIAVYYDGHTKLKNTKCRVTDYFKAGGTYTYFWDLKG
jgi:hypothetical protein